MKRCAFIVIGLVAVAIGALVAFGMFGPAENPDPNHTHADFAVWFEDQKINFARPEFMSEVYDPESNEEIRVNPMRKYLHLHDDIGTVIHRHKPGLTIDEFFASLDFEFTKECFRLDPDHASCDGRMFVNGKEVPVNPEYVFEDGDTILITYTTSELLIQEQLDEMTNDACRYSRTCPWRGAPPAENCIADPTVPCVIPD